MLDYYVRPVSLVKTESYHIPKALSLSQVMQVKRGYIRTEEQKDAY